MVKIKHLKRFNGFDEGSEREVKKEDAIIWEAEGYCEILKEEKEEKRAGRPKKSQGDS